MNKLTVSIISFFILMCSFSSSHAAAARYVEIKNPFVNVYEFLDPKSNVITQAKKGDHFELVYEGKAWFQIKIKDKVGWLEKKAGIVVNNPQYLPLGTFFIFVIMLLGTLVGVSMYIYKQKAVEV
jgi:SH3-like domain-containing protein